MARRDFPFLFKAGIKNNNPPKFARAAQKPAQNPLSFCAKKTFFALKNGFGAKKDPIFFAHAGEKKSAPYKKKAKTNPGKSA